MNISIMAIKAGVAFNMLSSEGNRRSILRVRWQVRKTGEQKADWSHNVVNNTASQGFQIEVFFHCLKWGKILLQKYLWVPYVCLQFFSKRGFCNLPMQLCTRKRTITRAFFFSSVFWADMETNYINAKIIFWIDWYTNIK